MCSGGLGGMHPTSARVSKHITPKITAERIKSFSLARLISTHHQDFVGPHNIIRFDPENHSSFQTCEAVTTTSRVIQGSFKQWPSQTLGGVGVSVLVGWIGIVAVAISGGSVGPAWVAPAQLADKMIMTSIMIPIHWFIPLLPTSIISFASNNHWSPALLL